MSFHGQPIPVCETKYCVDINKGLCLEINADKCSTSTPTSERWETQTTSSDLMDKDVCNNYAMIWETSTGGTGGGWPKCKVSHVLNKTNEECVTFNDPNDVKPPLLDVSAYWLSLSLIICSPCLAFCGYYLYFKIHGEKKETSATQVELQL